MFAVCGCCHKALCVCGVGLMYVVCCVVWVVVVVVVDVGGEGGNDGGGDAGLGCRLLLSGVDGGESDVLVCWRGSCIFPDKILLFSLAVSFLPFLSLSPSFSTFSSKL